MVHTLASFYRGKRVLVSGHTGFQGGWLVAWLKLLGAQVCGYGLPPATRPNFFDATILDRGITSIFADIRDRNALATAFSELQPEIVIHCATQTHTKIAWRDPVQTFATNVMGTIHVLEEVRQTESVRAVVITSRAKACEETGWFWGSPEQNFLGTSGPISPSLGAAELATSAYIGSFFAKTKTGVGIARMANLIGGGDWAEGRLVPDIVRNLGSDQSVVVHDDRATGWQHVLEAARTHLLLGKKLYEDGPWQSGAWDFTPAESDRMAPGELAKTFVEQWGEGKAQIEFKADNSAPKAFARLNTNPWRAQLGCTPLFRLEEAIAWTVEWYRRYYSDPHSACRVTEEQIGRFMRLK
jgi:CDP-glucose 4,6-dehydratase